MKVFGLFKKIGIFGNEELIQLYSDENYAFSQIHSRNLLNSHLYHFIKILEIDETKNQTVLCAKRKDCII